MAEEKAATLEETLTEKINKAASAGEEATKTQVGVEEEATGSDKGKTIEDTLAGLPQEDRERVLKTVRGHQSRADKAQSELDKFRDLDSTTLDVASILSKNPALTEEVKNYLKSKETSETEKKASEKIFQSLMDSPDVDGPTRSNLKKLQEAVRQEALETQAPYLKRLEVVENFLLGLFNERQDQGFSSIKTEMGNELFSKYDKDARLLKRSNPNLSDRSAFQAVMSDEDLIAWKRTRSQESLQRKKQASEVTGEATPKGMESEVTPTKWGKGNDQESRNNLHTLLSNAIKSIKG